MALLCMLGALMFAPAALAEHTARHVQQESERADFAEAQVASGAWTVAQACNFSGFYFQTHGEQCMGVADTASPTATATATPTATVAAAQYKIATAAAAQYQYKKTATALPDTGGATSPGALALGAGALLLVGGLLARRIIR